jgi:hypothetical protein
VVFRGLLTCAHDDCVVTAEVKKEKYVYYRCSGGRGPCDLPRFREQEIADKLGHVLKHATIPREVAQQIEDALKSDHVHAHEHIARELARLTHARDDVRRRMDSAYMDKLDGKIAEEFWQRKQADWQAEEARITTQIQSIKEPNIEERSLDVHRILELAQNAHSLYLTRKPAEQGDSESRSLPVQRYRGKHTRLSKRWRTSQTWTSIVSEPKVSESRPGAPATMDISRSSARVVFMNLLKRLSSMKTQENVRYVQRTLRRISCIKIRDCVYHFH